MSFFRKPTTFEWISLIVIAALFIGYLVTGSQTVRYLIFAAVAFYFTGRIFFNSRKHE